MPKPLSATISGSSAGTVLGLNKYQTPLEFWQKTMEQIEPGFNSLQGYVQPEPFEGNASTRFGHAFESANIALTEEKLGQKITDQERVFKGNLTGNVPGSCHVDGLILEGGIHSGNVFNKDWLYEGKTTTQQAYRNGWDEEKNIIPRTYNLQGHHNIAMAQLNGIYLEGVVFSVLIFPEQPDALEELGWQTEQQGVGNYKIHKCDETGLVLKTVYPETWASTLSDMGFHKIYRIPRNDELIDAMLKKYSEWWEKYIIGRTAPDPMNIDDIKRLCPAVSGTVVIEDAGIIDAMAEYKEIGAEIGKGGNMSKRRDQLKVMVLDSVRKMDAVVDDESTDKWIFRDSRGNKIGSYYKTKAGAWTFRA